MGFKTGQIYEKHLDIKLIEMDDLISPSINLGFLINN